MPSLKGSLVDAGALNRHITLLAPEYNEFGDEITAWVPAAKAWAFINPVFSMEVPEAGRDIAVVTLTVLIRYRTDLDARWRIQDRSHTYEISGIQEIAAARTCLLLQCRELI